MTCCAIALALAYQLIGAWRACKRFLGIAPSASRAPRAPGVFVANLLEHLRRPGWRVALFAALALEAGAAGAYTFEHRHHIGRELAAVVFEASGFATALCRGDAIVAMRVARRN